NTIMILTSDNGIMLGEHRLLHKGYAYEESIRVPLLIAYPGTEGAKTLPQTVLNNDLAPTIAALAGATPTITVDGRSLLPLFANLQVPWRRRFLIEHWSSGTDTGAGTLDYSAVRTTTAATRKLVTYPNLPPPYMNREFYDLSADPFEMNNLQSAP